MIRVGAVTNEAHAWCAKNSLIRDVIRWVTIKCPPRSVFNTSKHLCTAGLYAAHDIRTLRLPCVKPSPTCHAALGRCGEARDEATHLHDSSLVYTGKVPIRAFCVHVADCVLSYRCIYYVVSFLAACSIAPAASELVIKSVYK